MSFAYSVAIRLTVANLASQGVRMLAKDLMAAHGGAVKLGDKLKALKLMAIGYGMDKAGEGMLGFMGKAIDASKEYTRQIALMNAAGMTHREVAGSIASAWQTSRSVITTTAAENLQAIRELRSVFGKGEGMGHAFAVLPTVQRAQAIMQALTGKDQPGLAFDMIKAIEFGTKGAITVPGMLKQSEMMTKALMAFNGTLTVSDFHTTLKAAKSASAYLSDDFKYTILPTIMQEFKSGHGGAQGAGTALATLFGTIKGHAIQTRMIPAWVAGGLINPGGIVADAHHKGMSRIGPNGIAGESLFTTNPLEWAQRYLIPARDKIEKKYHVDDVGAYYALSGNRNSVFMLQTLANKAIQIQRDQGLIKSVGSSYTTYQKLLKSDPELAEKAMHNQWQNILAVIGYKILPPMLPIMVKFANGLNRIGNFMQNHPNLTSGLAVSIIALGGSLMIVGKAMMFIGMVRFLGMGATLLGMLTPIGLFVAGITVLSVGLFELYQHWNTVGPPIIEGLKFLGNGLADFFGVLTGIPGVGAVFRHFTGQDTPPSSPYVATRSGTTQGQGNVYLDGKLVGKHLAPYVSGQMAKRASAPNRGISSFDIMSAPMRPATAR